MIFDINCLTCGALKQYYPRIEVSNILLDPIILSNVSHVSKSKTENHNILHGPFISWMNQKLACCMIT